MLVRELIDYLSTQDPDAEVELVFVEPVEGEEDELSVIQHAVAAVADAESDGEDGAAEGPLVWLIAGENDDVEAFLDLIEADED
jgi:hypothetical protein